VNSQQAELLLSATAPKIGTYEMYAQVQKKCSKCHGKGYNRVGASVVGCAACQLTGRSRSTDGLRLWTIPVESLGWALAGIDSPKAKFIICKYGQGSDEDMRECVIAFFKHIHALALTEKWDKRIFKNGSIVGAVIVVMQEAISSGRCGKCEGRRWVLDNDALKKCSGCFGTGANSWPMAKRAERMGINEKTFRTGGWRNRYQLILREILYWEAEALADMFDRIAGNEE